MSVSVRDQSVGTPQIQVTDRSVGDNSLSVRDQSVGTPQIQVTDRSVGESSVSVRDQGTSASTCCGAGIPRFLLSLPTTPGPQSEVIIEEELNFPYVQAIREKYDEEEVPQERLEAAIRYLNTREGGIRDHRSAIELMYALEHIESMRSRMDTSGCPQEYTYEELRHLLVEESGYGFEDFERVLEEHCKTNGFLPSPDEFVELHHKMKGIVKLEEEVAETRQEVAERTRALEETRQEVKETRQEVKEKTLALERTKQQVEKTTQQVVESHHKNLSLRERLTQQHQQHQQALQQAKEESERKDRKIQQTLQRVKELEQNPEGELQRLLSENEFLKEKNNSLSAQAQRVKCKICLDEEVQIFFLPCGHLVTCERCATRLNRCPMCRQNIQDTIKVLLA